MAYDGNLLECKLNISDSFHIFCASLLAFDDKLVANGDACGSYDLGKKKGSSYEEAISATGYGRYHYLLLCLCGWAVSSDAVEILGVSFILPPATCELGLSTSDKGWINSSVFLGMMVGGFLWGTLADFQGRRSVLLWCLSINAIGGLLSSFAHTTWMFILMRFISGLGVGGSMPVIFTYFCEFQPKHKRGAMISVLATFWMGGNILAAALAWIIIPLPISLSSHGFSYTSWRLYLALCILPSFTSVLTFVFLPESPKFLMFQGKDSEALAVLQRIYASNNKAPGSEYPITELCEKEFANDSDDINEIQGISGSWTSKVYHKITRFFQNTVELFKRPWTSVTIVMAIIYFTLSFGYYGLFMWFPELFTKVVQNGGSVCASTTSNATVITNTTSNCSVANSVYLESFFTAASNLPGNIVTILVIDRVGRKIPLVISMVISGLLVFFIYMVKNRTQMVIMSCLFSGISVIGWNALDVLQSELFPTHLRSTASGVLMSIGRIAAILGNTAFGQLVNTNCAIPMLMVAGFLAAGGLSAIKLPNMTKKDLL